MAKAKKQETAPKSCQECEHWNQVSKKLRVGDVLARVIKKMEASLDESDFKASLTDYLKLVQLEKELGAEVPQEIKVTWVEPEIPSDEK